MALTACPAQSGANKSAQAEVFREETMSGLIGILPEADALLALSAEDLGVV
jgi:hypothetical protein